MADLAQMEDALRKAHAKAQAGDAAAAGHAKRIADAIRAARATASDFRGDGGGRGSSLEAGLIGARQGATFGFGDEINAGVRAAGDWLGGKVGLGEPVGIGEAYDARLAHERGLLDQTRRENPVASLAGEIGGAVLIPGGAVKATTVAGAAAKGALAAGAFGAVSGAGNAEGGAAERAKGAAESAAVGALFGGAASAAITAGTKGFRHLYDAATRKPTVERLRAAKTAAYKAVETSGEMFQPADLQGMAKAARAAVEDGLTYVEEVDAQTRAALTILDRTSAKPQSLSQLDNIRKALWKRANAAPDEPGVLDAIDAIDDLIESRAGSSDLMQAARAANRQFKKAELLDLAMKRAEDQTASTGSGGNILNKYKQAVTSIVNDPKRAKWFSAEEMATMQKVIDGSLGEEVMRRIGKIAPGGNGLMTFLNLLGASTVGAPFLAATAVGTGAKAIADNAGRARVDAMFRQASGAAARPPVSVPGGVNALTGYMAGRYGR